MGILGCDANTTLIRCAASACAHASQDPPRTAAAAAAAAVGRHRLWFLGAVAVAEAVEELRVAVEQPHVLRGVVFPVREVVVLHRLRMRRLSRRRRRPPPPHHPSEADRPEI